MSAHILSKRVHFKILCEKKRDKSNDDGSGGNDCDDASDSNGKN